MDFEWDDKKSRKTKQERGLDFNDASQIWDDRESLEIPVRSETESRWAKVGMFNGQVHTAIFTLRGTKIRIISVRRAHLKEIEFYEQN